LKKDGRKRRGLMMWRGSEFLKSHKKKKRRRKRVSRATVVLNLFCFSAPLLWYIDIWRYSYLDTVI